MIKVELHPNMNVHAVEACVEEYLFRVQFLNSRTSAGGRRLAQQNIDELVQQIEDAGALRIFNHLLAKAVAQ